MRLTARRTADLETNSVRLCTTGPFRALKSLGIFADPPIAISRQSDSRAHTGPGKPNENNASPPVGVSTEILIRGYRPRRPAAVLARPERIAHPLPMHRSSRCLAYARRTGNPCQAPAMPNGRCRMHGGKSTGAPRGNKNAWKHGAYSATARAERILARQLIADAHSLLQRMS